eukprot:symbB.v1.2.015763.t1/scaffold1187.1/size155418/12
MATRSSSRNKEIEELPLNAGSPRPQGKTVESLEGEAYFKMVPRVAEYFELEDSDVECLDLSDIARAEDGVNVGNTPASPAQDVSAKEHPRLAG